MGKQFYQHLRRHLLIFGVMIGSLSGCVNDPEVPVPGYLVVRQATVTSTPSQGAATHGIKDIWVIIDSIGEHGIYPVHQRIPIIADGDKLLYLFPGIRVNGVKNESILYEPYKSINLLHDFTPGKVDTVDLAFSYKERTGFPLIEGFEQAPNWRTLDTSAYSVKNWQLEPASQPDNGQFEGRLALNSRDSLYKAELAHRQWISGEVFINKKVYMEVDVKSSDLQLALGFYIKEGAQFRKTLNAFILPDSIGDWRKFYFDFTAALSPEANKFYQVFLFTAMDTSLVHEAELRVDNLKIITY